LGLIGHALQLLDEFLRCMHRRSSRIIGVDATEI
jgi:hypothetical protein